MERISIRLMLSGLTLGPLLQQQVMMVSLSHNLVPGLPLHGLSHYVINDAAFDGSSWNIILTLIFVFVSWDFGSFLPHQVFTPI